MRKDKPRHYRLVKGHGYWSPTPKMKALGFRSVALGPHGPDAKLKAEEWNAKWDAVRPQKEARVPFVPLDRKYGFVYFLFREPSVKIGFTRKPGARMSELQVGADRLPDCIFFFQGSTRTERALHARFAAFRKTGEWFGNPEIIRKFVARAMSFQTIDAAIRGTESEWELHRSNFCRSDQLDRTG